jgi:hypothetical protein
LLQDNELDLPRPNDVPVIWQHDNALPERKVLIFPNRD